MTGYQPVPSLPDLHKRGLAEVVARSPKTNEPTHYRASTEGQALLDRLMLENGRWLRDHPEESAARTREAIAAAKVNAPGKTKKK